MAKRTMGDAIIEKLHRLAKLLDNGEALPPHTAEFFRFVADRIQSRDGDREEQMAALERLLKRSADQNHMNSLLE